MVEAEQNLLHEKLSRLTKLWDEILPKTMSSAGDKPTITPILFRE